MILVSARSALKKLICNGGFDRVLDKLEITSLSATSCVCELKIMQEHQNRSGYLHGGMTSTLVDAVSTIALMCKTGKPGVSVDMNVTFISSAAVGEVIVIEASTLKAGKSLAFLAVDLKCKMTGKLIAQGRHTKFFGSRADSTSS